jgi:hypothetical protein
MLSCTHTDVSSHQRCNGSDLKDHFGQFGRVTDAFCIHGKNGSTNPGVGFVTFTTAQEVLAACLFCRLLYLLSALSAVCYFHMLDSSLLPIRIRTMPLYGLLSLN